MNKCSLCNKHKSVFKNTNTNEKLCLICGIKMQYKLQGIKGIFETLKFHVKCKWIFSWKDKLIDLLIYAILTLLTAISISSFIYVILTEQYWLIANSIISIIAIIILLKNS